MHTIYWRKYDFIAITQNSVPHYQRFPSNNRVDGLFEYEEYISLKAVEYTCMKIVIDISDPNEGFETITELCGLLDQIHSLQKLIFAHFQPTSNNECRIAGLIPLVQES